MKQMKAMPRTRMAAIQRTRERIKSLQQLSEARTLSAHFHYNAREHEIQLLKVLTRGAEV